MNDVTEARVDSAASRAISSAVQRPEAATDVRARLRLPHLDGMRAVAAIYVVMFHAVLGFAGFELSGKWRLARAAFGFGHEAVAVFIVLSGYCLMLPVARAEGEPRLGSSFAVYAGRRAFRILPPYFAAAALTLLAIATLPPLARSTTGTIWDQSLPAFEPAALFTHALLIHNWVPDLAYRINGPHWSVATEWQIYFCFPLLLLPIWRRLGVLATCAAATAVGYAPIWLFPSGADTANPWYLLLFVLGMTAASIGLAGQRPEARLRTRLDWRWLSAALWAACLAVGLGAPRWWFAVKSISDLAVGAATAALLVHLTERARRERSTKERGWVLAVLEWPPAVALGHMSYSLYLTHLPVVALCYFAWHERGYAPPLLAALTLVTSVVASVLVAYPFHVLVERPFMKPPRWLRARSP